MNRRFKGVDGLKVPQIGWNCLETLDSPLWKGLPLNPYVYFVHSYFPVPADDTVPVIAWSCYGERFAAAAGHGSVWGVQFHPEKSQTNGLRILANFVAMVGDRARSA
jgi:glutamine amidotransferase